MNRLPRIRGDVSADLQHVDPQPIELAALVRDLGGSPGRRRLLGGLLAWRQQLRAAAVTEAVLWLGGSFLDPEIESPGDLDLTTLLQPPGRFGDPDRVAWRAQHAGLFDRETRLAELGLDGPVIERDAPDAFRWAQRCYAVYCSAPDGSVHGFLELALGPAASADDAAARAALDATAAPPLQVIATPTASASSAPPAASVAPPEDEIVRAVIAGYAAQDGVWALALGGSRARAADADPRSDWDFVVVVDPVKPFASQRRLALALPGHLIEVTLKSPPGTHLRRIILADGRALDLTFVARADVASPQRSAGLATVVHPGLRILADRAGLLAAACARTAVAPSPPPLKLFASVVQRFFAFALPLAHAIRRDDLWAAGTLLETAIKRQGLMTMARWHALASGVALGRIGAVTSGRHLERWLPAWLTAQLPALSPGCDAAALEHALRTVLDVFGRLVRETADMLALADPGAMLARGRGVVERALER